MRLYRLVWDTVAVLVLAASVAGLALSPSWPGLLAAVVASGLTGASMRFSFIESGQARGPVTRAGMASAGLATVLLGLATFVGPWSVPVAAVLGLSAPAVPAGLLRRRHMRRPVPCGDQLARWETQEILERWARSSAELSRRTTSLPRRLELVEERSQLLDALIGRDPLGFQERIQHAEMHR